MRASSLLLVAMIAIAAVSAGAAKYEIMSYTDNSRVWKSLIVAQFTGLDVAEHAKNPTFEFGVDNKTPEFLKANPFHKVPTLFFKDNNGQQQGVFESNSMARFLAREGAKAHNLYGNNNLEASTIDAFLDTELSFHAAKSDWFWTVKGWMTASDEALKKSKEDTKKWLVGFNRHLDQQKTKFLVGDSVSLADIVMYCAFIDPYAQIFDAEYISDVPLLTAWLKRVGEIPQVKAVVPAARQTLLAEKSKDEL
eukprot:GFYU01000151.1.p2 GENE.GFYU01000151.1~~GFYU01000151.1.p2  ORF type:complete len:251 (-),score=94.62 GFYU01000151.1:107-859(-)